MESPIRSGKTLFENSVKGSGGSPLRGYEEEKNMSSFIIENESPQRTLPKDLLNAVVVIDKSKIEPLFDYISDIASKIFSENVIKDFALENLHQMIKNYCIADSYSPSGRFVQATANALDKIKELIETNVDSVITDIDFFLIYFALLYMVGGRSVYSNIYSLLKEILSHPLSCIQELIILFNTLVFSQMTGEEEIGVVAEILAEFAKKDQYFSEKLETIATMNDINIAHLASVSLIKAGQIPEVVKQFPVFDENHGEDLVLGILNDYEYFSSNGVFPSDISVYCQNIINYLVRHKTYYKCIEKGINCIKPVLADLGIVKLSNMKEFLSYILELQTSSIDRKQYPNLKKVNDSLLKIVMTSSYRSKLFSDIYLERNHAKINYIESFDKMILSSDEADDPNLIKILNSENIIETLETMLETLSMEELDRLPYYIQSMFEIIRNFDPMTAKKFDTEKLMKEVEECSEYFRNVMNKTVRRIDENNETKYSNINDKEKSDIQERLNGTQDKTEIMSDDTDGTEITGDTTDEEMEKFVDSGLEENLEPIDHSGEPDLTLTKQANLTSDRNNRSGSSRGSYEEDSSHLSTSNTKDSVASERSRSPQEASEILEDSVNLTVHVSPTKQKESILNDNRTDIASPKSRAKENRSPLKDVSTSVTIPKSPTEHNKSGYSSSNSSPKSPSKSNKLELHDNKKDSVSPRSPVMSIKAASELNISNLNSTISKGIKESESSSVHTKKTIQQASLAKRQTHSSLSHRDKDIDDEMPSSAKELSRADRSDKSSTSSKSSLLTGSVYSLMEHMDEFSSTTSDHQYRPKKKKKQNREDFSSTFLSGVKRTTKPKLKTKR